MKYKKYRIIKQANGWHWGQHYNESLENWYPITSTLAFTKWGCKRLLNHHIKNLKIEDKVIEEFET